MLDKVFSGKKIFVTGGLGFIGSTLVRRLVDYSAAVTIIDALIDGQGGNEANIAGLEDLIDVRIADIGDEAKWHDVEDAEYVFNLAGFTSHVRSHEEPLRDLDINCRSHLQCLEVLRKKNLRCKLVLSGSRSQYGKASYLPMDESHPFNVTDINGVHKVAVEHYHRLYSNLYGMPCCRLRLANIYGPRHQMSHSKQGFLNWFVRVAMDGGEIKVFGTGEQKRDFVYVDDAVEAILRAAAEPACYGEALNVGSGEGIEVKQAAEIVAGITGTGFSLVPFPKEYKQIEVGDLFLDVSKIKKLTGWQPEVSLTDGVARTIDFYRLQRDEYW